MGIKVLAPLLTAAYIMIGAWGAAAQGDDAKEQYHFNHGPYVQGLSEDGVIVYFTTSAKGFSRVEARRAGGERSALYVTIDDGLIEANNTSNAIALKGLEPATDYEYRLVSNEIETFRLSQNIYGDTLRSPWYTFRTLDPAATSCSFITTSDIHDDAEKYRTLLSYMPLDKADMVFLLGDILSHFSREGQPYTSFIDVSVEMFAKEKPFVLVRGNHDTRGALARTYDKYVYRPGGHFYGVYSIGDTFIIMIDTGEDKLDSHHDYSGITAFDDYRAIQAEWLKEVIRTDEFKSAKRRIVMAHIPPIRTPEDQPNRRASVHGADMVYKLYLPILNGQGIDLMISGHTHRHMMIEPVEGEHDFPILVNDNRSASYFEASPEGIKVKTVNLQGETTLERTF